MNTRNQTYSNAAYGHVTSVSPAHKQKYGSMCHKLPVLVRQAGLVQALTFVDARGGQAHHELLDHLANTLNTDREDLMQRARRAELEEYMMLTRHVLDAMLWFKRFAQSVLKVTAEEGESNDAA